MKIGLLAYHSACNFGATLQLLSTYKYFEKKGHTPLVINWIPADLEDFYRVRTPAVQFDNQLKVRSQLWNETARCHTSQDVADVIRTEGIDAVVIGSDAVAQHHPWQERIVFPTRRVFTILPYTSDRMFPNPFWGTFNAYLDHPVPVAVISASCQDSAYQYFPASVCRQMEKAVKSYVHISVRDTWTRRMIEHVTHGQISPAVTPDPVFAFNANAGDMIPAREEILTRFGLRKPYILLSFFANSRVTQEWIDAFRDTAGSRGYECVMLPFSQVESVGQADHTIPLPVSPLDWYGLIKYSAGYVGNNMHPVVVSLHNAVPFFSFDNYGRKKLLRRRMSDDSSKILHILTSAGLSANRVSCIQPSFVPPPPQDVFERLTTVDTDKEQRFAAGCRNQYLEMMNRIDQLLS